MIQLLCRVAMVSMLLGVTALSAATPAPDNAPKPASAATLAAHEATAKTLPLEDRRDAGFAQRGFIATRTDPLIRNAQGKPVWNTAAYQYVTGPAPAAVNPSLWREMGMLKAN